MTGAVPVPVTVAVLEDDSAVRESLRRGLGSEGFTVIAAATGTEFLSMLRSRPADVLVIDIGLPDADGRDVALAVRAQGISAPVLFLSARGSVTDRVSGFSAGGDDYVVKPFALAELAARLRVLSRRSSRETGISLGAATLDPVNFTMAVPGLAVPTSLTPTEFKILAALAGSPDLVRRADLIRSAWAPGSYVSDNTLDSYIARLRRKIAQVDGTQIGTVHGVGYRLITSMPAAYGPEGSPDSGLG